MGNRVLFKYEAIIITTKSILVFLMLLLYISKFIFISHNTVESICSQTLSLVMLKSNIQKCQLIYLFLVNLQNNINLFQMKSLSWNDYFTCQKQPLFQAFCLVQKIGFFFSLLIYMRNLLQADGCLCCFQFWFMDLATLSILVQVFFVATYFLCFFFLD